MKKRPNDPLMEKIQELRRTSAKAPEPVITDRELFREEGSVKPLKELGEKLEPEGYQYASSFAVHLYKKRDSVDAAVITQASDTSFIPEAFSQMALRELGIVVMKRYGREAPARVGGNGPEFRERTSSETV